MNNKQLILFVIGMLALSLFSACGFQEQANQTTESQQPASETVDLQQPTSQMDQTMQPSVEVTITQLPTMTASPTRTQPSTETSTSPENNLPTATAAVAAIITPHPTQTPGSKIRSDFVRQLCPNLDAPLGLFSMAEPYIDYSTDPETVYVLYQVKELLQEGTEDPCTLYLSPGPLGEPLLAGNTLFWKSFDYEAETVTIWRHERLGEPTENTPPNHIPMLQTTVSTSIGKAGLADFVASKDGELLVWSYTDPRANEDGQLAYVQTIYAISPGDPVDQRPASELWFDIVPENDGRPHIIRLQSITAERDLLYFSDEPIGLGRHWPEPTGRYSSLYSISTWGEDHPDLHYDCGQNYWCISDFSEEVDLLVTIQDSTNVIEIRRLSSGEQIGSIQAPEPYNFVRQAMINPEGRIVFMGVALDGSIFDALPSDVAIFYSEPPYTEDPLLVVSDAGLQNLLGWLSSDQILAEGNRFVDDQPEGFAIPSNLMSIDITAKSGLWLPVSERGFSAVVR